jgi:hypothetical protein
MLEPEDVKRFARNLEAMFAKAGIDGDPEAFAQVLELIDYARTELAPRAAAELRAQGYSWANLGAAMGVTKQTVQERFGRIPARRQAARAAALAETQAVYGDGGSR